MMNFDSGTAHIVYASDDRLAQILEVSLVTLYNSSEIMEIRLVEVMQVCGAPIVNKLRREIGVL